MSEDNINLENTNLNNVAPNFIPNSNAEPTVANLDFSKIRKNRLDTNNPLYKMLLKIRKKLFWKHLQKYHPDSVDMYYRFTWDSEPSDEQLEVIMEGVKREAVKQREYMHKQLLIEMEEEFFKVKSTRNKINKANESEKQQNENIKNI